jgi:glycopeptide antibiotics resistance protein
VSSPLFPALAAFVGGGLLVIALTVPYVAWSYRNRGELGSGHVAIAVATTVYAVALFTYTLVPFPASDWCAQNTVVPQLAPLQFLSDIRAEQVGTGPVALLRNPALLQIAFNVALFVPLGMVARYVFRRGFVVTVLIGLATSLLLELTQLTGVWGLAACTYRLFDVDDLLVNTLGAAIGFAVAPLLRVVPGQRVTLAPDQPRPVTGRRRALGMVLDVLLITLLGAVLQVGVNGVWVLLAGGGSAPAELTPFLTGVVPALAVLGAALSSQGATPGQRAVRLRPSLPDGRAPGAWQIVLRWAVGLGGFTLLATIDLLPELLGLVSVIMAWFPRDHRGLSGVVAGLRVHDARWASGSRVGEATEPIP